MRTDVEVVRFAYSPDPHSLAEVAELMHDGKFGERSVEILSLRETGKAHAVLPVAAGGRKFVVVHE
jgi:hypothetical protein